tara:strand:+ start:1266 stop:2240 length:975 start_codon:yes stop_codon:yes gene_type:complete
MKDIINLCQVSLARDIPLILENYLAFKKHYHLIKIFIICPKDQILEFKEKCKFEEFNIICEDDLISIYDFNKIYKSLNQHIEYKEEFSEKINWYYQQILKISFVIKFVKENKEKITIWDADTILLNQVDFFKKDFSIKYGTFHEFHKPYYITNRVILKEFPDYFISFLIQFISITELECDNLLKNIFNKTDIDSELTENLSKIILQSIFKVHPRLDLKENYNASLFSEYELIGQANCNINRSKQKVLLSLRYNLTGKLTDLQKVILKILNFKHVTYEHSQPVNLGMLDKKQSSSKLFIVVLKILINFNYKRVNHIIKYYYYLFR